LSHYLLELFIVYFSAVLYFVVDLNCVDKDKSHQHHTETNDHVNNGGKHLLLVCFLLVHHDVQSCIRSVVLGVSGTDQEGEVSCHQRGGIETPVDRVEAEIRPPVQVHG